MATRPGIMRLIFVPMWCPTYTLDAIQVHASRLDRGAPSYGIKTLLPWHPRMRSRRRPKIVHRSRTQPVCAPI